LRVALNTPLGVLIKNTAAAEEPNWLYFDNFTAFFLIYSNIKKNKK
jgi:hypothetical protein